jgi:hypothetical protein
MADAFTELMRDQGELPCQSAPELFFERDIEDREEVPLATASRYKMAKALCNDCPIRQQCLSYAMEERIEYGIWGQTTPLERAYIRKA